MSNTRIYVSAMLRDDSGKFLILQRRNGARFAPGQWEFISGTPEPHETAEATAVREVAEETGISLAEVELQPLPPCELHDADGRWIVIPYTIHSPSTDVHISHEHQAYRWVAEDELKQIPYVGEDYLTVMK
jgi:8-oxo-dGTP pyrophosphatase MutT (NUDIX family)